MLVVEIGLILNVKVRITNGMLKERRRRRRS